MEVTKSVLLLVLCVTRHLELTRCRGQDQQHKDCLRTWSAPRDSWFHASEPTREVHMEEEVGLQVETQVLETQLLFNPTVGRRVGR